MLKLENIDVAFAKGTPDEAVLFDNFSYSVKQGEFVSVIGSNGSGKTTLLNLICGSLMPDSGQIYFEGKPINHMSEHKRANFIGRVFQDPKAGTCGNLTILENLSLADNKNKPFNLLPAVSKNKLDRFRTLLESCEMGLENRLNTPVGSLSGGQRQALALVMANMTDIKFLILDEHTAALDPKSSEIIMQLTDKFVKSKNITTVMVTHNLRFALEYGSRLTMMHNGNCVIDCCGSEKQNKKMDDLLEIFDKISIEVGN